MDRLQREKERQKRKDERQNQINEYKNKQAINAKKLKECKEKQTIAVANNDEDGLRAAKEDEKRILIEDANREKREEQERILYEEELQRQKEEDQKIFKYEQELKRQRIDEEKKRKLDEEKQKKREAERLKLDKLEEERKQKEKVNQESTVIPIPERKIIKDTDNLIAENFEDEVTFLNENYPEKSPYCDVPREWVIIDIQGGEYVGEVKVGTSIAQGRGMFFYDETDYVHYSYFDNGVVEYQKTMKIIDMDMVTFKGFITHGKKPQKSLLSLL